MNKPYRVLIWHDESDHLFEVNDPLVADSCLNDGLCVDVTGDPVWEKRMELLKSGIDWTLDN